MEGRTDGWLEELPGGTAGRNCREVKGKQKQFLIVLRTKLSVLFRRRGLAGY